MAEILQMVCSEVGVTSNSRFPRPFLSERPFLVEKGGMAWVQHCFFDHPTLQGFLGILFWGRSMKTIVVNRSDLLEFIGHCEGLARPTFDIS